MPAELVGGDSATPVGFIIDHNAIYISHYTHAAPLSRSKLQREENKGTTRPTLQIRVRTRDLQVTD